MPLVLLEQVYRRQTPIVISESLVWLVNFFAWRLHQDYPAQPVLTLLRRAFLDQRHEGFYSQLPFLDAFFDPASVFAVAPIGRFFRVSEIINSNIRIQWENPI